jgi:hypothetical protein
VSRSEQGELEDGDCRPGRPAPTRVARAWDAKGHEPAESVAQEKHGVRATDSLLHALEWRRGRSVPLPTGRRYHARRRSPSIPSPSLSQRPACAVSTYLDQVEKLGIDGETGRGTGR